MEFYPSKKPGVVNITTASIDIRVSSKWAESQFCIDYAFKKKPAPMCIIIGWSENDWTNQHPLGGTSEQAAALSRMDGNRKSFTSCLNEK